MHVSEVDSHVAFISQSILAIQLLINYSYIAMHKYSQLAMYTWLLATIYSDMYVNIAIYSYCTLTTVLFDICVLLYKVRHMIGHDVHVRSYITWLVTCTYLA